MGLPVWRAVSPPPPPPPWKFRILFIYFFARIYSSANPESLRPKAPLAHKADSVTSGPCSSGGSGSASAGGPPAPSEQPELTVWGRVGLGPPHGGLPEAGFRGKAARAGSVPTRPTQPGAFRRPRQARVAGAVPARWWLGRGGCAPSSPPRKCAPGGISGVFFDTADPRPRGRRARESSGPRVPRERGGPRACQAPPRPPSNGPGSPAPSYGSAPGLCVRRSPAWISRDSAWRRDLHVGAPAL